MENIKENNKHKYVQNIINQLLDYGIIQFEKIENQDRIKTKILDPIIQYIGKKLYPYVIMTGFAIFLILLIAFFIIYFRIK